MSGPDFSGLVAPGSDRTKRAPAWRPLQVGDLTPGAEVLAFDQSLRSTGWVMAYLPESGANVNVLRAGTLRTVPGAERGPQQNLGSAIEMYDQVDRVLARCLRLDTVVVYETPPVGGKMARPESSLLSALAILLALRNRAPNRWATMVSAQKAKRLICGNANADKQVAHKALFDHCAPWITYYELVTNEHTRDALMLALTAMRRTDA